MQDGIFGAHHRAIARSESLNGLCRDVPSRILIELIRSFNPERAFEIAEILLFPGLEASLARELPTLLEGGEFSEREFAIMVVLFSREPEPVIPADLAYALGLSIGIVHGSLSALEKKGSIARHHCRKHRRRTYFTATAHGRLHISRALVVLLAGLESLGRGLPVTARLVLTQLCDAIRTTASRHIIRMPAPMEPRA